jgi:predicted  nucleic acid-binding Zn-ribbon protein
MGDQEKQAMIQAADQLEKLGAQVKGLQEDLGKAQEKIASLEKEKAGWMRKERILKLAQAKIDQDMILPEHLETEVKSLGDLSDEDLTFQEKAVSMGLQPSTKIASLSGDDPSHNGKMTAERLRRELLAS